MHKTSMDAMEHFVNTYVRVLSIEKPVVLDVGSMCLDNHDTYRKFFNLPWQYHGLDLKAGNNVDIVADDLYHWPILDDTYDVVISGQCLEHVEDLYAWIREVARVLKPNGIVCIIAPVQWMTHRYPVDCWRILPDGMVFLLGKIAGLTVISCREAYTDCIGIAKKVRRTDNGGDK
jgi:SAM-dependent methyltransferase